MRHIISGIAVAAALAVAVPASAQSAFSIEVEGYGAVPTGKWGGAELGNGFGFGGNIGYRFLPQLGVYAGWDWNHFRSDDLMAGQKTDVEETGYAFGLRFEQQLSLRVGGWLRAGGLYKHIELEDPNGNTIADSDHGFGWEIAGGVAIPVSSRLHLTPGVRFRNLSREIEFEAVSQSRTLSYVSFGTGLTFAF